MILNEESFEAIAGNFQYVLHEMQLKAFAPEGTKKKKIGASVNQSFRISFWFVSYLNNVFLASQLKTINRLKARALST